jgi:hypothetical protein
MERGKVLLYNGRKRGSRANSEEMVCTKTLYNFVTLDLFGGLK